MSSILTNFINIDAPDKDIEFNGIDFTENAFINISNARSISIRNCRIYGLKGSNANKYFLKISGNFPIKVIIERCFFGNNTNVYNLLELNSKLDDGTSICYNYFKKGNCTHNEIGLYGAVDNSNWNISSNYFEDSQAGIRIGMKYTPICNITIDNNTIQCISVPDQKKWEGLVTIQPYGKITSTFENVNITLNGNKLPVNQYAYMYIGENDSKLTVDKYPKVTVNGAVYKLLTFN